MAKRLRDEVEQVITEAMAESPMVREWWRTGPNVLSSPEEHITALYASLKGLEAAISLLADEIDQLKTRL